MALTAEELKKPSGYLKVIHVILGAICIGIVGYYISGGVKFQGFDTTGSVFIANEIFFYMLVTFCCLFTSFLLLLSFLNEDSAVKLRSSHFEILYHLFSFIFYAAATISVIVIISKVPSFARKGEQYAAFIVAIILAAANTLAYLANAIVGFKA